MSSAHSATSTATATARSSSSALGDPGQRDVFQAEELAIVLSHYDLGTIESIQEFARGSRRAPKLRIAAEKGEFLLKRRARGKDDPFKVAFAHQLQLYLAGCQFPLPQLIGTKADNNSMLQWRGRIYEVFEYIRGSNYDNSLEATQDSGKTLGLFHRLVREYRPRYEPARGSYHAARSVQEALQQVPATLAKVDPRNAVDHAPRIEQLAQFLHGSYVEAATRANELGLKDWPLQIVHSDWHPGNMLFRKGRVAAVIDYDAARLQPRIVDAANGALQFSILGGADEPSSWPDYLDGSRFKRFLRGYDSVNVLSRAELRAIPWLMIEALIAETVIPVAATGSFARLEGFGFMLMIERKVRWLHSHAERLATILDG